MLIAKRIIFWVSLFLIFIFLFLPFVFEILAIEFANVNILSDYKALRFYLLPIAILLTMFGTLREKYSRGRWERTIGLTVYAAFFSFLILGISFFFGMCAWTDKQILFNKNDAPATQIVLRDYGCGAWDSGRPIYNVVKVKKINSFFNHVVDIDTTKIDRGVWRR